MTTVKLRYTVRKRGKLFWQPTPAMRRMGFHPKALGEDGPEAQAEALKLYQAWLTAKGERKKVTSYPPGTFGAFFDRYKRTTSWAKKSPRTWDDYTRAWRYIDAWRPDAYRPTLSRTVITQISSELVEAFADHMVTTASPSERYRTVKCLKALMSDAVVRLRLGYASPADTIVNSQPKGRSAIWLGAEVEKLAATAHALGYDGMGHAIRIAWDTLFSPVDVWTITKGQLKQDADGAYIERARTKTSKEAFGALSEPTAAALQAYIDAQPAALLSSSPIIRQRNGNAYRSKDTFGDDFRAVRAVAFPGDKRQFLDIRRSGNVEADASGADKETMGELLANGLADNRFLEETYTPPTVTKAREVQKMRAVGRAALAGEIDRVSRK